MSFCIWDLSRCRPINVISQHLDSTKMSFSSVMSRARFEAILRFLHFGENPKFPNDVDHLNNTMRNIFTPGEKLSLDESLMLWRGRLIFRQYIKN